MKQHYLNLKQTVKRIQDLFKTNIHQENRKSDNQGSNGYYNSTVLEFIPSRPRNFMY